MLFATASQWLVVIRIDVRRVSQLNWNHATAPKLLDALLFDSFLQIRRKEIEQWG